MERGVATKVSWPTYVLVVVFGLGSWISVNGLWVELPVLVEGAPEKWNLPSYLVVIIQLANVGPLAYSIGNHFAPRKVTEKPVIYSIVLVGAIVCILLAFFWDKTSFIGGVKHSTALLILSFFLAIVDCTSSVVFLTFMGLFPSPYMSALFVGETLSGVLPSFVALGQGMQKGGASACNHSSNNATITRSSGHNAKAGLNFGPEAFFFFLSSMMIACGAAFLGLNYLSDAKRQQIRSTRATSQGNTEDGKDFLVQSPLANCEGGNEAPLFGSQGYGRVIYLLCIQAWINCLANGVLSSILSFASEPYGHETYHLVVNLSSISSALVCFVALWVPSRSSVLVTIFASLYTLLSAYILVLAAMSPTPPLHTSAVGSVIIILVNVAGHALGSYTKLTICTVMKEKGQRALFWCGISIQVGSCIGAVVMFPLVNVYRLFHQAPSC